MKPPLLYRIPEEWIQGIEQPPPGVARSSATWASVQRCRRQSLAASAVRWPYILSGYWQSGNRQLESMDQTAGCLARLACLGRSEHHMCYLGVCCFSLPLKTGTAKHPASLPVFPPFSPHPTSTPQKQSRNGRAKSQNKSCFQFNAANID